MHDYQKLDMSASRQDAEVARPSDGSSKSALRYIFAAGGLAMTVLLCLGASTQTKSAILSAEPSRETRGVTECVTKECLEIADELNEYIDFSVDPCDDFYSYTCGKWEKKNPIPADQAVWHTFGELRLAVLDKLKLILESTEEPEGVPKDKEVLSSVNNYYASCMDTAAIDAAGTLPVKDMLKHVDSWASGKLTTSKLLAEIHSSGFSPFFNKMVWTDEGNTAQAMLRVEQSGLGLPSQSYYEQEKSVQTYTDFITALLKLSGEYTDKEAKDAAKNVAKLEAALAKIQLTPVQLRDPRESYNPKKVTEVEKMTGALDGFTWKTYLKELGGPEVPSTINLAGQAYFKALFKVIEDHKDTFGHYIKATVLRQMSSHMTSDFVAESDKFSFAMFGATAKARWNVCVDETQNVFPFAVGRLYAERFFPEAYRTVALDMVKDLRVAMGDTIDKVDWMSDKTKIKAQEKLSAIATKIGFPDTIFEDEWLSNEYKNYHVDKSSYILNYMTAKKAASIFEMELLSVPTDRARWEIGPAVVNAYYNPANNDICFPAGILVKPFFSPTYPRSLNYGAMGMVIGHEITHGFDDQGSQYNSIGNLEDWWTKEDGENFRNLTKCVADQYSTYQVDVTDGKKMNINGPLTLGENLADNGGIAQSWKAYKAWVAKNGEPKKLPNTKLTHDQMFFVGFARGFCANYRPERMLSQVLNGPHSPGEIRILGTASNHPGFAEAFNCKPKKTYSPDKKCKVW